MIVLFKLAIMSIDTEWVFIIGVYINLSFIVLSLIRGLFAIVHSHPCGNDIQIWCDVIVPQIYNYPDPNTRMTTHTKSMAQIYIKQDWNDHWSQLVHRGVQAFYFGGGNHPTTPPPLPWTSMLVNLYTLIALVPCSTL